MGGIVPIRVGFPGHDASMNHLPLRPGTAPSCCPGPLLPEACIPVGAVLACIPHIRPAWLEEELRHLAITFRGAEIRACVDESAAFFNSKAIVR